MVMEGQVDTGRITHLPQMHRDVPWKIPVRVATTAAGTLATDYEPGDTVDGETLVEGDRVLLKDMADAELNGIYVVQAADAPLRAFDFDADEEAPGAFVYVQEGTANAGKLFVCTTLAPVELETTSLAFEEFAGGGSGVDVSLVEVAAAGSTETVDVSVARTYDLTLTDDLTLTLDGAVDNEAHYVTVAFRQNGTGGWEVTHPGSVVWADSAPVIDPAAGAVTWVNYVTFDGGTVWYGFPIGVSPITTHDDLTGVTANQHHAQAHAIDGADHTLSGAATGDVLTATSATTFAFQAPSAASAFIPVDTGTPTYDDSGDNVEITVATVFGVDGSDEPYYDATGAVAGEEAVLYWDPANSEYVLVPYNFP